MTENNAYVLIIDYKSEFDYKTRIIIAPTAIEACLLALERKMNIHTINCKDHD